MVKEDGWDPILPRACGLHQRSLDRMTNIQPEQEYAQTLHIVFAPFLSTHFSVFELHISKWVIFVRRRPCVYDTFRFSLLRKKDRIWHRVSFIRADYDN